MHIATDDRSEAQMQCPFCAGHVLNLERMNKLRFVPSRQLLFNKIVVAGITKLNLT